MTKKSNKRGNGEADHLPRKFIHYMMNTDKYIRRLCRNIINGHFNWRRYRTAKSYFGRYICVQPLFCSYGQIGYSVYFPHSREPMPDVEYDWELHRLTLDETDWRAWLRNGDEA